MMMTTKDKGASSIYHRKKKKYPHACYDSRIYRSYPITTNMYENVNK